MDTTNWLLEGLKIIPTTVIGAIAIYIAHSQWRTAHQKVVLDLFDRRMKVYDAIQSIVIKINNTGEIQPDEINDVRHAINSAGFLFGDEVTEYLRGLFSVMIDFLPKAGARNMYDLKSREELDADAEKMRDSKKKVVAFHKEFRPLCMPYMKLDQKL